MSGIMRDIAFAYEQVLAARSYASNPEVVYAVQKLRAEAVRNPPISGKNKED